LWPDRGSARGKHVANGRVVQGVAPGAQPLVVVRGLVWLTLTLGEDLANRLEDVTRVPATAERKELRPLRRSRKLGEKAS
jgi:hypothetical protein